MGGGLDAWLWINAAGFDTLGLLALSWISGQYRVSTIVEMVMSMSRVLVFDCFPRQSSMNMIISSA